MFQKILRLFKQLLFSRYTWKTWVASPKNKIKKDLKKFCTFKVHQIQWSLLDLEGRHPLRGGLRL